MNPAATPCNDGDDTVVLERLGPTAALWWMAERANHVRKSKLHQWRYELEHGADVNGIGVAGGAGGDGTPGAGASILISVGFGSTFTGGFAEALVYGADNGAQVSSNSSGRCGNPISRRAASIRWRGG